LRRLVKHALISDFEINDAPEEVLEGNFALAFNDEFDGTEIDQSKWNTSYYWGPDETINNEEIYYVDTVGGQGEQIVDPFSFEGDGCVTITAAPITGNRPETLNGIPGGQLYTSGLLAGWDKSHYFYGYREVRLQGPRDALGSWAAAWELNWKYFNAVREQDHVFNPEIDWPELVHGNGFDQDCAQYGYHWFDNAGAKRLGGANPTPYIDCSGSSRTDILNPCIPGLAGSFNTYGVLWLPDRVQTFLNGQPINCITDFDKIPMQEMYSIVNLAVGGDFPGPSNPADYPAQMKVDYWRVYRYLGV